MIATHRPGGVSFDARPVRNAVRYASEIRSVSEPWPPLPPARRGARILGVYLPRLILAGAFAFAGYAAALIWSVAP